jgi:hypothetical protein
MKTAVASLDSQAEDVVAGSREDADHQRDRCEAEQHERHDVGEDDGEREGAEQHDGAERAEEHDDRERQALERAAGLLDVNGRRVGLVNPVPSELRVAGRRLAGAQRVVLGCALVGAGLLAQVAGRVAAVAVTALGEVVAADVAGGIVRADRGGEAVVVEPVGVDAVAQPAELEHDPGPVDERVEQVVGDLLLGLLGVVERAAGWRPTGTPATGCSSNLLASPIVRCGW